MDDQKVRQRPNPNRNLGHHGRYTCAGVLSEVGEQLVHGLKAFDGRNTDMFDELEFATGTLGKDFWIANTMKFIYFLVAIPVLVSSLSIDVLGDQQGQRSIGDYDQIGLFDGDLNFAVPLINIGGRGSASASLFLNIRQPIIQRGSYWFPSYHPVSSNGYEQVCNVNYITTTATYGNQTVTYSEPYITDCNNVTTWQAHYVGNWLEAAWLYPRELPEIGPGYGPGKFYGIVERIGEATAVSSGSIVGNINQQAVGGTRVTFRFDLPDGSSHTFVDTETKGAYSSWDIVSGAPTCPTRGRNFVSVDGSSMTFVSDDTVSSCGTIYTSPTSYVDGAIYQLPTGHLLGNDGTKYRIENGLIKWIKDRNGNKTSFYYDTIGRLIKAVDSLEREVDIVYDVNDSETAPDGTPLGLRDEIRFKTIGQQDQKIVLTKSNLENVLKEGHTLRTLDYLWQFSSHNGISPIFNKKVVSALWTPGGTATKFKYDSYAMLARIDYSSGRAVEYDYEYLTAETDANGVPIRNRSGHGFRKRLKEKRAYSEGSDPASLNTKTTFSPVYNLRPWGSPGLPTTRPVEVLVKNAGDLTLSFTKHYFYGDPISIVPDGSLGSNDALLSGKEYKTETINPVTSELFQRTENTWKIRDAYSFPSGCGSNPHLPGCNPNGREPIDPIMAETTITLEPNSGGGLVSKVSAINPSDGSLAYDSYNNRTDSWEYGYGVGGAPTIPIRHNHWDYLTVNTVNSVNYSGPADGIRYTASDLHMRSLPSRHFAYSVNQSTGQETLIGKSEIAYDEPGFPLITEPSVPQWENPLHSHRGNPTTSKVWYQEGSSWLESHSQFDNFGNVRKVWDASGDTTKFVETQYDPLYKYAYPTKVIAPAPDPSNTTGTNQTSTVETTYDFTTGLPLTAKDDFGQITRTEYDAVLRPVRVFAENFTAPEAQTFYGVPNASGQLPADQRFVKVRKQIDATNWDEAITWFDGLGRTIKTQAKDSQGDVFVDTVYDSMGRVERVTNPYRLFDPTVYWSKTRYDAAGRAVESYAPTELANLANAQSLGVTSFDISTVTNFVGTVVTSTDASSRKGRSITNALGQLLRVDEPTATGGAIDADLGTLSSPHQPTYYTYSPQGKMVKVQQGVQNRYFKYDSLGRLLRVRQPEQEVNTNLNLSDPVTGNSQWTAGFSYDVLGNVLTATDANGVTITNTYDRANRVKTRTYSGEPAGVSTPAVSFFYDGKGLAAQQSPNYAKGKLTKVTSSVSETRYSIFDNFGRLKESQQITDGSTYTSKYTYNLSGALIEEEYPSGRKVKNEFESDGDLARIYGTANPTATERTYANAFSYNAAGNLERLRLGNGRLEHGLFNNRHQLTQLALGASSVDSSLWKVNYEYGEVQANGTVDASKNTGTIAKQTISFSGLASPFVQTYKYDSLSRVKEAKETVNNQQTWKQTFAFDRYGNRIAFTQDISGQQLQINNLTLPTVDPNTNRFTANQGYTFDKNGNLINDPTDGGRQFIFNGENKQTEVKNSVGTSIGKYFYDGEGKRVKKVTDMETTIFVYSAGKLVAEYSTQTPPANPTTNYVATDTIQSVRVVSDGNGQVVSRRDFLPFGEELYADGQNRTTNGKYSLSGQDAVRQRFTGYQKDMETGFDFAEARYYNNRHGRFTAVDPLLASGKNANPQTFNRYAYVVNSPLNLTDKTGMQIDDDGPIDAGNVTWLRYYGMYAHQLNNYLRWKLGFESNQADIPNPNAQYRETYTSRGVVPRFVQPDEPVGAAIKQFNSEMEKVDETAQQVPIFGSLYNSQKAGFDADRGTGSGANAIFQTGMFGADLAGTVFTGGANKTARTALAANMAENGVTRPLNSAAHHLVAFADQRAGQARAILEKAGIDINDAVNGVFLPANTRVSNMFGGTAHTTIHTNAYYKAITARLQKTENVREELNLIRKEIINGTFPY